MSFLINATPAVFAAGLFLLAVLHDPSLTMSLVPVGDTANDLSWAQYMVQEKTLVFFGGFSNMGFNNPGVLYLWPISIGYALGGVLGSYLVYSMLAAFFVAIAAVAVNKGAGSRIAGYAFVTAVAVLEYLEAGSGLTMSSFHTMQSYSIGLAALTASAAAAVVPPREWRWAPAVAFCAGLYSMSIWVGATPVGVVTTGVGLLGVMVTPKNRRKTPIYVCVITLCLVAFPLMVRWFQFGWFFPVRYAQSALELRNGSTGGSPFEALRFSWNVLDPGIPVASAFTLWAACLTAPLVAAMLNKRRRESLIAFYIATTASMVAIFLAAVDEPHYTGMLHLLLKIGFAYALAGLATVRLLSRAVVVSALSISLCISSLAFVYYANLASPRFASSIDADPALSSIVTSLDADPQVKELFKQQVQLLRRGPKNLDVQYATGLLFKYGRVGGGVCVFEEIAPPGTGGFVTPTRACSKRGAAGRLLISPSAPPLMPGESAVHTEIRKVGSVAIFVTVTKFGDVET